MDNKTEELYDEFIDNLLEIASREYRKTAKHEIHQEKIKQMHEFCESDFTKDQLDFLEECFGTLLESAGAEMSYVFRKAMLYGILIIKKMGIIT